MIERWMEIIKDKGTFDELTLWVHSSGSIKIRTTAISDELSEVVEDTFEDAEEFEIALQGEPYKYSSENSKEIVNLVRGYSEDLKIFQKN